jgi:hypothetical protein
VYDFAAFHEIVGQKAYIVGQNNERRVDVGVTAPNVAVKHFEQFAVNVVKVFANDYSAHGWSRGYDVDNLGVNLVPKQFGIASEQRHIYFEMNVAHFDVNGFLVERDEHSFFVFQF